MAKITYEQAFADHKYLWGISPAHDMTGGYVDQDDLCRLLKSPTKATAAKVLSRQIGYWFQAGTEDGGREQRDQLLEDDPRVREIQARHC